MRRAIWTPVAVTVLLWAAAAILPHAELSHWRIPVKGAPWLAPPSWPVPVLREHRFVWAGFERAMFAPSWPPFALRHGADAPALRSLTSRVAGPLALARAKQVFTRAASGAGAVLLACVLALALGAWLKRPRGRRALLLRRVSVLAERGLAHSLIARQSGLPRDAVRDLLQMPLPARARKHA